MTLFYVPLENLDRRYTIMMDRQLQKGFREHNIKYHIVDGKELTSDIETGAFLDSEGTNYFKSSQVMEISKLFREGRVENNDKFFFSDLWFPGLPSVKYMSMFKKINVDVYGVVHAGSFTDSDFVAELKDWAQYVERGWFDSCTNIFLGSNFIKQDMIDKKRITNEDKLVVTGLPFDYEELQQYNTKNKENIVVFPSRFHWEKGADTYLEMAEQIGNKHNDWQFHITGGGITEVKSDKVEIEKQYWKLKDKLGDRLVFHFGLNKDDYFKLLAKSKIVWSSSFQENFGYAILEAMSLGCFPVTPNRVSYTDYIPEQYRYNTLEDGIKLVSDVIDGIEQKVYRHNISDIKRIPKRYEKSIDNMIEVMKK